MSLQRRPVVKPVLDLIATVAMIVAAGTVISWAVRSPAKSSSRPPPILVPSEPQSLDGAPRLGRADAPVVIIVFSDFECSYCGKFAREVLPALRKTHIDSGGAQLGFRHYPLPMHGRARRAAQSAACASEQGRFWAMHNALFLASAGLEEADLTAHAARAGLKLGHFETCMAFADSERVEHDVQLAKALSLAGTPTLLVGLLEPDGRVRVSRVFPGVPRLDQLTRAIADTR